jgi:hypothetical protein
MRPKMGHPCIQRPGSQATWCASAHLTHLTVATPTGLSCIPFLAPMLAFVAGFDWHASSDSS